MSISKKIRFEVFKRDGFKCVYCGKTPPEALLEVDHINPKSKGGKDDINNLATSCFDCNRGKRAIPITIVPYQVSENLEILKEKELQLAEYNKVIKKIQMRIDKSISFIETKFQSFFPDMRFTPQFKASVKNFLNILGETQVADSMEMACSRKQNCVVALKYFCGICWNKIKGLNRKAV